MPWISGTARIWKSVKTCRKPSAAKGKVKGNNFQKQKEGLYENCKESNGPGVGNHDGGTCNGGSHSPIALTFTECTRECFNITVIHQQFRRGLMEREI